MLKLRAEYVPQKCTEKGWIADTENTQTVVILQIQQFREESADVLFVRSDGTLGEGASSCFIILDGAW